VKKYFFLLTFFLLIFPSSIHADEIYLNQLGYALDAKKVLLVEGSAKEYSISDGNGVESVISFDAPRVRDRNSGREVRQIDLTFFNLEGEHVLAFGDAEKYLTIARNPYREVVVTALRSFYLQRCGMEINDFSTGMKHELCHFNDGVFDLSVGKRGIKDCLGGWHDAGDYGKYVPPANYAVSNLLLYYDLNLYKVEEIELDIPKLSLLPDVLDEIKYELDWLLTMQDEESGGVYHKLTPKDFALFVMPDKDLYKRYIYRLSSNATAGFAGAMAQAYQVYVAYDPEYANKLLDAAERAWGYLQQHPRIVPPGGFHNPPGVKTGVYGVSSDLGARLFAAVELYKATGAEMYHQYFKNNFRSYDLLQMPYIGWRDLGHQAYISYLWMPLAKADEETRMRAYLDLLRLADLLVKNAEKNGFLTAMRRTDYVWGSNGVALDYAKVLIFAYELTREGKYRELALDHLHYILGRNALDKCFVTDFGEDPVRHLHHRPSVASGIAFPGFVAGGPNSYFQDPKIVAAIPRETPPALVYLDNKDSFSTNENSIYWNASFVFVAGYFAD
jgi:endoglucanase